VAGDAGYALVWKLGDGIEGEHAHRGQRRASALALDALSALEFWFFIFFILTMGAVSIGSAQDHLGHGHPDGGDHSGTESIQMVHIANAMLLVPHLRFYAGIGSGCHLSG